MQIYRQIRGFVLKVSTGLLFGCDERMLKKRRGAALFIVIIRVCIIIVRLFTAEMPRKYKRTSNRRGMWTEQELKDAVLAVTVKKTSIREAGRRFHVPERTLRRRLANNSFSKCSLGPSSYLGIDAENKIVAHIKRLQKAGFSPTATTVKKTAFELSKRLGLKQKFNPDKQIAGRDWYLSFMERHPELNLRKPEGISVARVEGMCREEVGKYYELLKELLTEHELLDKPGHIFNMDETSLPLNNISGKVVAIKKSKKKDTAISSEGETIKVLACCSAKGQFLPPYCIFKGANKKPELEDNMPSGSVVVMNRKTVCVNRDIFLDWMRNHFAPRKPADGKTILILDEHSSHMSFEVLEFAVENNIVLLCLPSHATHYLQPLNRCFFRPLRSYYYQAYQNLINTNGSKGVTRLKFGNLLNTAWSCAATTENATQGFRITGIYPYDANAIPDQAFAVSDPQKQENQIEGEPNSSVAIENNVTEQLMQANANDQIEASTSTSAYYTRNEASHRKLPKEVSHIPATFIMWQD